MRRNALQRKISVRVPVYRFGQSPETHQTSLYIAFHTADQWYRDGSGVLCGRGVHRHFLICETRRVLRLDKHGREQEHEEIAGPLPDGRIKAMSLGTRLIWQHLNGSASARAVLAAFRPGAVCLP